MNVNLREKIDEVIADWLEDVKYYTDSDLIITIPRTYLIPEDNVLQMLNIDNQIGQHINTCLEKIIETYYETCTHIPGLMYTFLKENTYLFSEYPHLEQLEEEIDKFAYNIHIKTLEFKVRFGNRRYFIVGVEVTGYENDVEVLASRNLIRLRFGDLENGES